MQQELATLLRSKPESLSHSNFNTLFLKLITSTQEAVDSLQDSPQLMAALRTISEFDIEDTMSEATFRFWATQSWIREEAEVVEVEEEPEVVEVREAEVVEVEADPEQEAGSRKQEAPESSDSEDSDSSDSESSDSESEAKTARHVSEESEESESETNTARPVTEEGKKIPVKISQASPKASQASPAKKIPVITTGARPFQRIQKGEREKEPEDVNDLIGPDSDSEEEEIPKKPFTPSYDRQFQEQYKYKSKKSSIQDPELPSSPARSLFKEGKTFNCCCCC